MASLTEEHLSSVTADVPSLESAKHGGESLQKPKLVSIDSKTVDQTWPILLKAVEKASFIAVDLEFSGLGSQQRRKEQQLATQSVDQVSARGPGGNEKYLELKEIASSYSIISMGVACFQWEQHDGETVTGSVPCKVEVFDILLLSQHPYTIDSSSAKFLLKHGFDFKMQFTQGLPYTPAGAIFDDDGTARESKHLDELFQLLVSSPAPLILHNGWMDLLFLFHACYGSLPDKHYSLKEDLYNLFSKKESDGVYDTKVIARHLEFSKKTFLEYIYTKAFVSWNKQSQGVWLKLIAADYPSLTGCAVIDLPQIPELMESELTEIKLCPMFAKCGRCRDEGCRLTHDVIYTVLMDELLNLESDKTKGEGCLIPTMRPDSSFSDSTAKPPIHRNDTVDLKESHDTKKELCDSLANSTAVNSHSAGYDAFMTGYVFAYFTLTTHSKPTSSGGKNATPTSHTKDGEAGQVPSSHEARETTVYREPSLSSPPFPFSLSQLLKLEGLAEMKNSLYNLGFGWYFSTKKDGSDRHRHASREFRQRDETKRDDRASFQRQRGTRGGRRSGFNAKRGRSDRRYEDI